MDPHFPLFSVIVPAYNSAGFISKCIESVLGQSCPEFELILVDDGSSDNTLAICQAYAAKDCRIKVLHKENGGHTSARNEGLKISSGEYIAFLDSDDWLALQTLELCQKEILNSKSDIVVFRMQNSDNPKPFPVLVPDGCYEVRKLEKMPGVSIIMGSDGKFVFPKSLSAKCFKRELLYNIQMSVPKEISIGEDGLSFIGTLLKSRSISVIANDDRACYHCLVRQNSVSRSADVDAFEKMIVLLLRYNDILNSDVDHSKQYDRLVVAELYTAALLVMRSGCNSTIISAGLHDAVQHSVISQAFKNAKFGIRGYRHLVKRFILRHRFWRLAKLIDSI